MQQQQGFLQRQAPVLFHLLAQYRDTDSQKLVAFAILPNSCLEEALGIGSIIGVAQCLEAVFYLYCTDHQVACSIILVGCRHCGSYAAPTHQKSRPAMLGESAAVTHYPTCPGCQS